MFGDHLCGDLVNAEFAIVFLAACHRNGVVVEDLVGNVDARGDRLADGEQAGVEIGAIAEIGEDVGFVGEGCFPDPGDTFAAHLGEGFGPVHPKRHDVAADAGERAAAFRRLGRAIVRTARAEIGRALDRRDEGVGLAGLVAEEGQRLPDGFGIVITLDACRDDIGDGTRGQFIVGAEQPFAVFVVLADDARAHGFAPVVELPFELMFDEFALFLDDEDFFKPFGKGAHAIGFERPGHADLVDPQADIGRHTGIDAQFVERFHRIGEGLAGGHDAEARFGCIPYNPVDPVGPGKGERRKALEALQAGVFLAPDVTVADMDAAFGEIEVRHDDRTRFGGEIDGGAGFDRVGGGLEANPGAGKTAHGQPEQAIFDEFVHRGRREEGHEGRLEIMVGLVGQGGRFGAMIVTDDGQDAAVGRGAGGIGVFEHVHGPIEAGALAIPDAENAIDRCARPHADVLRPPDCRGAEFFVDARNENNVALGEQLFGAPQLLIVAAQW